MVRQEVLFLFFGYEQGVHCCSQPTGGFDDKVNRGQRSELRTWSFEPWLYSTESCTTFETAVIWDEFPYSSRQTELGFFSTCTESTLTETWRYIQKDTYGNRNLRHIVGLHENSGTSVGTTKAAYLSLTEIVMWFRTWMVLRTQCRSSWPSLNFQSSWLIPIWWLCHRGTLVTGASLLFFSIVSTLAIEVQLFMTWDKNSPKRIYFLRTELS